MIGCSCREASSVHGELKCPTCLTAVSYLLDALPALCRLIPVCRARQDCCPCVTEEETDVQRASSAEAAEEGSGPVSVTPDPGF